MQHVDCDMQIGPFDTTFRNEPFIFFVFFLGDQDYNSACIVPQLLVYIMVQSTFDSSAPSATPIRATRRIANPHKSRGRSALARTLVSSKTWLPRYCVDPYTATRGPSLPHRADA